MIPRVRFTAYLILFATLLLWSGNWIVARAVREDVAPGIATAGRLVIVVALLAPFCWRALLVKLRAYERRDWWVLAALGFTGGGLHLAFQWLGLHYTTVTSAVLYSAVGSLLLAYAAWSYVVKRLGAARAGATMHLMPAIAVALAALFLDEVPRWYHFAGIALILAGVALSTFKAASVSSTR